MRPHPASMLNACAAVFGSGRDASMKRRE